MGFSDNLSGAALTVALPLGLLAAVVLWGFFERRPSSRFGGITKSAPESVGRPDIEAVHRDPESSRGDGEAPVS
jgi:hypothetical protein